MVCFMNIEDMVPGLNRYYLLVGMDIPKFTFTQYSYELEQVKIIDGLLI